MHDELRRSNGLEIRVGGTGAIGVSVAVGAPENIGQGISISKSPSNLKVIKSEGLSPCLLTLPPSIGMVFLRHGASGEFSAAPTE